MPLWYSFQIILYVTLVWRSFWISIIMGALAEEHQVELDETEIDSDHR